MSLASLLEHNSRGFRFTTGKQLDEAASLYREVLKSNDLADRSVQRNLTLALLFGGNLEAAKEELARFKTTERVFLELVLSAVEKGAAAVITDSRLSARNANDRASSFFEVALALFVFRKYDDMRALLAAGLRLSNTAQLQAFASWVDALHPYEPSIPKPDSPAFPVHQMLLNYQRGTATEASLHPYISSHTSPDFLGDAFDVGVAFAQFRRTDVDTLGLSDDVLADFILGDPLAVEGDDATGHVVRVRYSPKVVFYVVGEGDGYRVLGTPDSLAGVGSYALALSEKGEITAAQQWLDKVVMTAILPNGNDLPAMKSIWSGVGEAARGPEVVRIAAASLMGTYSSSPKAVEILLRSRAMAKSTYDRSRIDLALAEAYAQTENWEALLPVAKRLASGKMDAYRGLPLAIRAATELSQWEELEAIGALASIDDTRNTSAISAVISARAHFGDVPGAYEWLKKLKAVSYSESDALVLNAWLTAISQPPNEDHIRELEQQAARSPALSANDKALLALAMARRNAKQPGKAVEILSRTLSATPKAIPGATYWTVYVAICQSLGYEEAATEAGRRAKRASLDEYTHWAIAAAAR